MALLTWRLSNQVVDDASSYIGLPSIEITEHIGKNHMEMCRFSGLDDPEYKKVAAALRRIAVLLPRASLSQGETPLLDAKTKRKLMDSLSFGQIDTRQTTIKNAHADTCQWLLEQREYREWLDPSQLVEHHGFLWIKGKPGTGKSTLMKFALNSIRESMKHTIAISFFFNARGDDLQKTTAGMYRSILLQLLERLPALQDIFNSLGLVTRNVDHHQWSVESLKQLLELAVQSLAHTSVTCFVDALDECDEVQVRDMISFFENIGEMTASTQTSFRVCFSSRHYPHVTIDKAITLVLERQEGHGRDIVHYVHSKLNIGHGRLAHQIRAELREKAGGIFMWVVLVVDILNRDYDGGRIHELRNRLRQIPTDLHALFRDILARDRHQREELLLCIQWIYFAKEPLEPEQLYFAIVFGVKSRAVDPEPLDRWDPEELTGPIMERFILSCSRGLAELTKSPYPTVQFIHESVRDFLFKENELKEMWPDLKGSFQGHSHERLKLCCLDYMTAAVTPGTPFSDSLVRTKSKDPGYLRKSAETEFPFLQYAVEHVLHHADQAEGGGINQTAFLRGFEHDLAQWIELSNALQDPDLHWGSRFTSDSRLLYILAEYNAANLIARYPSNLGCFAVGPERYGAPIFAAMQCTKFTGRSEAIVALLKAQATRHPPGSPLRELYKQYRRGSSTPTLRELSDLATRGVLYYLGDHGDEILLEYSLASGEFDIKMEDERGWRSITQAVAKGHYGVVRGLLDRGADIESKDARGRTLLKVAATDGNAALVRLLVERGAGIEARDARGATPLWGASDAGHLLVVQILLDKDAEVDVSRDGQTPLWRACRPTGPANVALIKLLLDRGANIEASGDISRMTPLLNAADSGIEDIAQLLLDRGADIEARDVWGRTPLLAASK